MLKPEERILKLEVEQEKTTNDLTEIKDTIRKLDSIREMNDHMIKEMVMKLETRMSDSEKGIKEVKDDLKAVKVRIDILTCMVDKLEQEMKLKK